MQAGTPFFAAAAAMRCPVAVDPVKEILATRGCSLQGAIAHSPYCVVLESCRILYSIMLRTPQHVLTSDKRWQGEEHVNSAHCT